MRVNEAVWNPWEPHAQAESGPLTSSFSWGFTSYSWEILEAGQETWVSPLGGANVSSWISVAAVVQAQGLTHFPDSSGNTNAAQETLILRTLIPQWSCWVRQKGNFHCYFQVGNIDISVQPFKKRVLGGALLLLTLPSTYFKITKLYQLNNIAIILEVFNQETYLTSKRHFLNTESLTGEFNIGKLSWQQS